MRIHCCKVSCLSWRFQQWARLQLLCHSRNLCRCSTGLLSTALKVRFWLSRLLKIYEVAKAISLTKRFLGTIWYTFHRLFGTGGARQEQQQIIVWRAEAGANLTLQSCWLSFWCWDTLKTWKSWAFTFNEMNSDGVNELTADVNNPVRLSTKVYTQRCERLETVGSHSNYLRM